MKRYSVLAIGLCLVVLSSYVSLAQPPASNPTLSGELQVGKRYHILPVGKTYDEQGDLSELIAIDKDWIKVKTGLIQPRMVWINLHQVGAIKTMEQPTGGKLEDFSPTPKK